MTNFIEKSALSLISSNLVDKEANMEIYCDEIKGGIRIKFNFGFDPSVVSSLFLSLKSFHKEGIDWGFGADNRTGKFRFRDGSKDDMLRILCQIHTFIAFNEVNCIRLSHIINTAVLLNSEETMGSDPNKQPRHLSIHPKELIDAFNIIEFGATNSKIDALTKQNNNLIDTVTTLVEQCSKITTAVAALTTQVSGLVALERNNNRTIQPAKTDDAPAAGPQGFFHS